MVQPQNFFLCKISFPVTLNLVLNDLLSGSGWLKFRKLCDLSCLGHLLGQLLAAIFPAMLQALTPSRKTQVKPWSTVQHIVKNPERRLYRSLSYAVTLAVLSQCLYLSSCVWVLPLCERDGGVCGFPSYFFCLLSFGWVQPQVSFIIKAP